MSNMQSFWDQVDVNNASQIGTLSDSYFEFLKSVKTEDQARDFIIRKLLNFRFIEIHRILSPAKGSSFLMELDDGFFAAGLFGRSDITKRGVNIIGCPIYDSAIHVSRMSPASIPDSGLSTIRITSDSDFSWPAWASSNISLHIKYKSADGVLRTIVSGSSRKDPCYVLVKSLEKSDAGSRKQGRQFDLVIGSESGGSGKGKRTEYPDSFLDSIGLGEKSLQSAKVTLVPVDRPLEIGTDRSIIQAFGSYERMAAFAALKTISDLTNPEETAMVLFYPSGGSKPKKTDMEVVVRRAVSQLVKAVDVNAKEGDITEAMQFSRFLDFSRFVKKSAGSDSNGTTRKFSPAGKGTSLGVLAGSTESGRSSRLLERVQDSLQRDGVPFGAYPKGFSFDKDGTLGSAFLKNSLASLVMSVPEIRGDSNRSMISKLDLWALYRTMLAFFTV